MAEEYANLDHSLYFKKGHVDFESPLFMLTSAVIWRIFYIACRFPFSEKSPEFSARIGSFLHGLVTAFLGINQCFLVDWPFDHPEWKTTYMQSFILVFSFGYFVHDLIWMLQYDRKDKLMLCHHIYCVYAIARIIFMGYSGAQATCTLGSMEITNPFLQTRWFLRSAGMKSTALFMSTELTFFLVFFIVRIVLGSYFLNVIIRQPKNDWNFIFMALSIYAMSWMFVGQIVIYVLKKSNSKSAAGTGVTTTERNESKMD